jgi:dCMP deaminase
MSRPNWDEYFLKLAMVVAERSTCQRRHVGAIAVKDKQILTTGYNGAPSGFQDCLSLGCLRNQQNIPSGERTEVCRAIHAEQNCVIQGSLHGISLEGATIYCTHSPCRLCAKQLVQAKIKRVVTYGDYSDTTFNDLFQEGGVSFVKVPRPSTRITTRD